MRTHERTAISTFDRVALDLSHGAFLDLATALRARIDIVLKHWRAMSLKAMPHLNVLTLVEFEDAIGPILEAAADALQSADPQQLRSLMEHAPLHGLDRFAQKQSLLDYFEEARILRGVIIRELDEELRRPLGAGEAETFHAVFDLIIQQGVIALVGKQGEELRGLRDTTREMNDQLLCNAVRQEELIEHARIADKARDRSERLLAAELAATRTLQRMSAELIQQNDPDLLYQQVLDAAVALTHSDFASLQMLEPSGERDGSSGELLLLAFRGFSPEAAKKWAWVRSTSKSSCGQALATRRRCIVSDVETCEWMVGSEDLEVYRRAGIRSVQSTPLVSRSGQLMGMISTYWQLPDAPSEVQLRPFDVLARQAADLIERYKGEETCARLAAIVASSSDAILSKDLTGTITTWNHGAERLFGYSKEEAVGGPVSLIIPADHLDEERMVQERIGRGESVEHYETVRRRKDGSRLNISSTVSPLRNAAGRVIGASTIARDITERAALENRIRLQAEALACESRGKDEFLAMLGHELRNPLAAIGTAAHLLHLQASPESENRVQRQAREVIERQVGSLARLVNDLLEVSRVVSGRVHLARRTVDLNQVIRDAVETTAPAIKQRRHALTLNLPAEEVWCHVDPARMEEVFINLLANAAKYTPDDGQIEVWCEITEDGGQAQVCVRDNGVGVDAELLPRIFNLFTQADRSLARSAGGMGVGLSLAQRLVQLHGGEIEVQSPPPGGKLGSEFRVRLALAPAPHPTMPTPSADKPEDRNGDRVLVVDDNQDSAAMLTMALRQCGYVVESAFTGPDALTLALEWCPDTVLLDIGLPGLDGYEVARRLRATAATNKAGQRMRLIALSGYGQGSDIELSRQAGFDAHLTKPFEFDEVCRLIGAAAEKPA